MQNLFWVVIGGGLGAALRHLISIAAYQIFGRGFPWGTLAANLIGCLLIGVLWRMSIRFPFPSGARLFLFTGTIGALTTFSTYGMESLMLLREGRVLLAALNIAVHNVVGIAFVALGFGCTELLFEGAIPNALNPSAD